MTATMVLYWIDALSNLNDLFVLLWCILIACIAIIPMSSVCDYDKAEKEFPAAVKAWGLSILGVIILSLLLIFIPSKKTMYMMMATHYAGESQLPEKVLKAIEVKLDEIIGEKE